MPVKDLDLDRLEGGLLDKEIVELRAACVMFCSHALDHASLSAYALMILNHKYKED